MRSAIIAAMAAVAVALPYTETIYDTKVMTITSCGPEVTDCPGKKTSAPAVHTTTCTDEWKKMSSVPAPPVYVSTSSAPAPPVYVSTSSAAVVTSAVPPPPYMKPSSSAEVVTSAVPPPPYMKPSSSAEVVTSAVPPPPYMKPSSSAAAVTSAPAPPVVTSAVPPPPYVWSTGAAVPSVPASYGTISTGVPAASKTASAYWSKTTSPATYTGAASNVQAAGLVMGAGAIAAFFL